MLFWGAMKEKSCRPVTVGFVSLGCPKNTVDSEKMLADVAQAGLLVGADADNADVVIINTCGFIAPAKAEALEAVRRAVARKGEGAVRKVIVAGCLSQRMGRELFGEVEGIDAVVGLGQRDDIVEIIEEVMRSEAPAAYLGHSCREALDDRGRLLTTPGHWAYLRISEGCDHRCSFCTIPGIRGRFRSKRREEVLAEAKELVSAGVVELNVIAQDTAYYGKDLGMKEGLAGLVDELVKIEGLHWVRVMYLYPVGITERFIETMAGNEKAVRYFDMPIQHINNDILRKMGRPERKEIVTSLIERVRAAMPDVVLRTTVIVGFPGETDKQFRELVDFAGWARFDALGCFRYYAESGTAAAEMAGQVPDRIKEERREELMLAQQKIAFGRNAERVGRRLEVVVDRVTEKRRGEGRFYGQAPDIDSVCTIENCSAGAGNFIETKVIGARDYDLVVEQI